MEAGARDLGAERDEADPWASLLEHPEKGADALVAQGPNASHLIERGLAHERLDVRCACVHAIGPGLGDVGWRLAPIALGHSELNTRIAAVSAVGRMLNGKEPASETARVQAVLALLPAARDAVVRAPLVRLLVRRGDLEPDVYRDLLRRETSAEVREAYRDVLAAAGDGFAQWEHGEAIRNAEAGVLVRLVHRAIELRADWIAGPLCTKLFDETPLTMWPPGPDLLLTRVCDFAARSLLTLTGDRAALVALRETHVAESLRAELAARFGASR